MQLYPLQSGSISHCITHSDFTFIGLNFCAIILLLLFSSSSSSSSAPGFLLCSAKCLSNCTIILLVTEKVILAMFRYAMCTTRQYPTNNNGSIESASPATGSRQKKNEPSIKLKRSRQIVFHRLFTFKRVSVATI